jgi:hypothetical protein
MLEISDSVAGAFARQGFARLRQRIVAGWHERLAGPATRAGEDGRGRALAQVETMAQDNPRLTEAQLVMLADIALLRQAPSPPPHAQGRG